jgi:NADPH2:quinone reductase
MAMRVIEAKTFSGYGGLRQTELPKPQLAKERVLVRVTAAGVTPLEYTVLSGGHPRAKAPLVLGNEGAGVIEDAGDSGLAVGSRVMFTGPYGVGENGAWQEWLLVRPEHVALVPDAIDDVVAASLPVAYLTAHADARRVQAGQDGARSGDRRVSGQRDLSARAGAGRQQGDIDGRQRGESR